MRFLESGPDVPLAEQSAVASRRGVPWWGAVVIAFGFSLLGIALDSATARLFNLSEGVHARQIGFALGCLLAALAVRNRGLFTAAVQPPLIAVGLVVARVVGVKIKGLVTSANVPDLNSLLIKQVFAFSNDFPIILFTFLAGLTVVVVRWRRYRSARAEQAPAKSSDKPTSPADRAPKPGQAPVTPRPESAAARASRAAAEARRQQGRQPDPRGRAAPAVVPSGHGRRPSPPTGQPAVQPRQQRMTAGAAAHGVRIDRSARPGEPAVRPAKPSGPPQSPGSVQPRPGRRRAAPPPLDDDGF